MMVRKGSVASWRQAMITATAPGAPSGKHDRSGMKRPNIFPTHSALAEGPSASGQSSFGVLDGLLALFLGPACLVCDGLQLIGARLNRALTHK